MAFIYGAALNECHSFSCRAEPEQFHDVEKGGRLPICTKGCTTMRKNSANGQTEATTGKDEQMGVSGLTAPFMAVLDL